GSGRVGRRGARLRGGKAGDGGQRARPGGALPRAACELQEAAHGALRRQPAALALRQGAARAADRAGKPVGLTRRQAMDGFDETKLAAAFEQLPALLEGDPNLTRRGAFFDARFAVGIGAIPFDVIVTAGRVSLFERGPFVMRPWRFAVRASAEAWGRLWQPTPEPGWHDLSALAKRGYAR